MIFGIRLLAGLSSNALATTSMDRHGTWIVVLLGDTTRWVDEIRMAGLIRQFDRSKVRFRIRKNDNPFSQLCEMICKKMGYEYEVYHINESLTEKIRQSDLGHRILMEADQVLVCRSTHGIGTVVKLAEHLNIPVFTIERNLRYDQRRR